MKQKKDFEKLLSQATSELSKIDDEAIAARIQEQIDDLRIKIDSVEKKSPTRRKTTSKKAAPKKIVPEKVVPKKSIDDVVFLYDIPDNLTRDYKSAGRHHFVSNVYTAKRKHTWRIERLLFWFMEDGMYKNLNRDSEVLSRYDRGLIAWDYSGKAHDFISNDLYEKIRVYAFDKGFDMVICNLNHSGHSGYKIRPQWRFRGQDYVGEVTAKFYKRK